MSARGVAVAEFMVFRPMARLALGEVETLVDLER